MNKLKGYLVFSFDFELMWGLHSCKTIEQYRKNIEGVWEVIPRILDLFEKYEIHCTWGTVGFLFCQSRAELESYSPKAKPSYQNQQMSNYTFFDTVLEEEDRMHFALPLLTMINNTPFQEIGSHTFSHYYSNEKGQHLSEFVDDIKAVQAIGHKHNRFFSSMIFPKNQYTEQHLEVLKQFGYTAYRGLEDSFKTTKLKNNALRYYRFFDSYLNLSGHNCYDISSFLGQDKPYNIKSSEFLRAYSGNPFLEFLKVARVTSQIKYAARNNKICHIWSHPHNFGKYPKESLAQLEKILISFKKLQRQYSILSVNMKELVEIINNENHYVGR